MWVNQFGRAIDESARLFVQDAKKYGMPVDVLGRNYGIIPNRQGAIDHSGVTYGLGIGDHTDVGPNFPWDVFTDRVNAHSRGTVVIVPPVRNEINHVQSFSPWLGARLDQDERPCGADGKGRFVQFAEGYIYFSEATGAHPIPKSLFAKWAETGWEQGPLGYPATDSALVPGGEVQGFENGALYLKDGTSTPIWVHGLIFDHWMKSDWERGPYGWPLIEEVAFGSGSYQDFEHGRIFFAPDKTVGMLTSDGRDVPLADQTSGTPAPPAAPAPKGYEPSADEQKLTPKSIDGLDPMVGGISWFAGTKDKSTRGRRMGISGEWADNPIDPWYCAMRFGYVGLVPRTDGVFAPGVAIKPADNIGMSQTEKFRLKDLLPNLRLKVTNLANGKQIVVRPADWGPGIIKPYRVIDVSERAEKTLEATTDSQVRVEWCDPSTPLGPVN